MKQLKERFQNKRFRAILFFGFYFVFFAFLFIIIATSPKQNSPKKESIPTNDLYLLNLIKGNNYHFHYQIFDDSLSYDYEGTRYQIKQSFDFKHQELLKKYIKIGEIYYQFLEDNWIKSDNPYLYSSLFDVSIIESLLEQATFDYKKEYATGEVHLGYKISTKVIALLLNGDMCENLSEDNEIILTIDNNKEVTNLEFNFRDYASFKEKTVFHFLLEYSDFGIQQNFDLPTV